MKAYSQDLRDRVIETYLKGTLNKTEIARLFNLCIDTVVDWTLRYNKTGNYSSNQGKDCGRSARFSDKESVLKFVSENPDSSAIDIRDALAPDVPMNTFYDTLKRMKISYKKKSQSSKRDGIAKEISI